MAYWIHETSTNQNMLGWKFFKCDYVSDIDKLPRFNIEGEEQDGDTLSCKPCAFGSEAFVIENSSAYMLSKDTNTWVEIS